jgi:hypothetical protein
MNLYLSAHRPLRGTLAGDNIRMYITNGISISVATRRLATGKHRR